MFFDIHTHSLQKQLTAYSEYIYNVFPDEQQNNPDFKTLKYYSIGLHPKDINSEKLNIYLKSIKKSLTDPNCVALGEIGLDKFFSNFKKQQEVFEDLLYFAELNSKPVIIHCVKSFSEILHYRKKYNKTPWIIHGFRGKKELSYQIIKSGIYISFGSALLNPTETLTETIRNAPINNILFETDTFEVGIEKIYKAFSDIRNIELNRLSEIVKETILKIFGDKIV